MNPLMTTEERKFWYRMEDAIRESKLSKCEIARRGGFHRQSITCTDGGLPQARILKAFCEITGVLADYLLGFREEMFR